MDSTQATNDGERFGKTQTSQIGRGCVHAEPRHEIKDWTPKIKRMLQSKQTQQFESLIETIAGNPFQVAADSPRKIADQSTHS